MTLECVEVQLSIMRDLENPANLRSHIAASLADRVLGKATQLVAGDKEHDAIQIDADEIHRKLVKLLTANVAED